MDSADLPSMPRLLVTPDEGRRATIEPGHLSAKLMDFGSMEVRWYAPQAKLESKVAGGEDPQVPHDRDELYVIVSGTALFIRAEQSTPFGADPGIYLPGEERVAVKPGDALFVPAGTVHRFEAMSADFGTWMIFYGPEGGDHP